MKKGRPFAVDHDDIIALRKMYERGKLLTEISSIRGISVATVYHIIAGNHPLAEGLPNLSRGRGVKKKADMRSISGLIYANLYGRYR